MKKSLSLLLIVLTIYLGVSPSHAQAAIAVDATSSSRASLGSLTFSHTMGSIANGILVCGVSMQDSNRAIDVMNDVTYNSLPMTLVRQDHAAGNNDTWIFYILNPASGAHNVVITAADGSTPGELAAGCVSFSGVDQDNPIDAINGATGNSTTPSVSLVTVADNAYTFTVLSSEAASTAVGTQTAAWADLTDQSFEHCRGAYKGAVTPAGSTALGYTISSGQSWAESALSLKPSGAALQTIQVDAISRGGSVAAVSTQTVSHTVGSGSNRILVCSAGSRDGATVGDTVVDTMTYGGVAMTQLRSDLWNTATFARTSIWYLIAPTTGVANVIATWHAAVDFGSVSCVSYTGVDQTTPFEANSGTTSQTVSAVTASTAITTITNNAVVYGTAWIKTGEVPYPSDKQQHTQDRTYIASPQDLLTTDNINTGTAGSYTASYTWVGSDGYTISLGALKPASAAVAATMSTVQIRGQVNINGQVIIR